MLCQKPLVSIVIATFNAGSTLNKVLSSISTQSYKNFEVIIIDGNSTDDTLSYIHNNSHIISKYISEPDRGIFDAWNKGLKISKGDWICFIGAGDEFYPNALEDYVNYINISNPIIEYVSSRIEIVDNEGNILMTKGSKWEWPKFLKFMNTPHVGSFHSRRLFEKYGEFDTSYKVAGDYEFLMRAGNKLNAGFLDKITVKMLFGGISITSMKNMHEGYRVKIETGKLPVWIAKIDYYVARFKAFIRSILFKNGIYLTIRK